MMDQAHSASDKKRSLPHTLKWMRELTLRQWRLADPVRDPNRNVHQASEHLDELLKSIGVSGELHEKKLRDTWNKVAGDFVSKHAQPESLKKGVLSLRVVQPTMRFHLEQMKGKLLQNLRLELGKDVVRQIRFMT